MTLTEERKVAWKSPGIGPDPSHWLVIFKKVGQGKILHKVLPPGERFKPPLWSSADSFEAYAVSQDQNLRHEFSRKYQAGAQTWTFTLHFKLHFRVESVEKLGLSLSGRDPLERLQDEVASVVSATARRLSWEEMKAEGEDFGLRLREAETTDGEGERKKNFHHLQRFASDLGLGLRYLDVLRSLTEPDLEDERAKRKNERQKVIVQSNKEVEVEKEQSSHELKSLKEQNEIERQTAIARSSQALEGMNRLRLILDTVAKGGARAIDQATGELRSFEAIHRALIEVQGIQASLVGLAGGVTPALAAGTNGRAVEGATIVDLPQLVAHRGSTIESFIAEAFQHLRILDENPRDQRRILASVLHLVAEAGLGEEADEEFLTLSRDDLAERLRPVKSAIPSEPRDFLESILDLDGLRQRLA